MSAADPDDDGRAADPGRRSDTFEEIVAGWRAEGRVPCWPDERVRPPEPLPPPEPLQPTEPLGSGEDHYVPPEPPPLPRLGRSAAVGLALLALGVLLLATPEVVGIGDSFGLPLGLIALAAGLGWLVLRSWPSSPPTDGDGEDDGAVL